MSSLPECKRCGVYVHGGPCYCERCGSIENIVQLKGEIADLKRKLSDSIQREQEVEDELETTERQLGEASALYARTYEHLHNLRAHADALAGALSKAIADTGGAFGDRISVTPELRKALKSYRNREE